MQQKQQVLLLGLRGSAALRKIAQGGDVDRRGGGGSGASAREELRQETADGQVPGTPGHPVPQRIQKNFVLQQGGRTLEEALLQRAPAGRLQQGKTELEGVPEEVEAAAEEGRSAGDTGAQERGQGKAAGRGG